MHNTGKNTKSARKRWKSMSLKEKIFFVCKWLGVSALILFIVAFFAIWLILKDENIDKVELEKILDTKQTVLFYDDNDELITGVYSGENRVNVTLEEVPEYVQKAFISIEDTRFYEHFGVDIQRIVGSLWADIKAGEYVQGASTISQQLIKLSHLTIDKKMSRKLIEAYMAIQLETMCSKEEILEMYLNYVYFGNGAYGIEAASRVYFGKSCAELTLSEGALLAGVVNSPARYAPHLKPQASVERRNLVLTQMAKYGYISEEEAEIAKQDALKLAKTNTDTYPYGYYIDSVINEACSDLNISMTELLTGGYQIYTSLDIALQKECETILAKDDYFPATNSDGIDANAAMIIMDVKTGSIKAVVGGRDYVVSGGLNRANQVRRQPGSAIKPILVYGPALEDGYISPTSPIQDEPVNINGYTPKNYNNKYKGWVTAREALAQSLNCPAVELLNEIGVNRAKSFAEKCGIVFADNDDHLALALGGMAEGTTPQELCNAYQSIANGGRYVSGGYIRRICDSNGKVLYSALPVSYASMDSETAYLLTDMMRSVVSEGTAKTLSSLDIDIAAKTGTVGAVTGEGNKDAWIVAYTTDYVACMWAGYDKQNYSLPLEFSGSNIPAQMMSELFGNIYSNSKPDTFLKPGGIVSVRIDARTLQKEHKLELASNYTPGDYIKTELFDKRFVPKEINTYWDVPKTPTDLAVVVNMDGMPKIMFTALQSHAIYRLYRVNNGKTELIKEFISAKGSVIEYIDTTTLGGESYAYYVLPLHSEVKVNNTYLQGKPSAKVTVMSNVPYASVSPSAEPTPSGTQPSDIWDFFR